MKIYEIYSETKNSSVSFNVLQGAETNSMINFICGGKKHKIRKSTLNKFNIIKNGFTYYTDNKNNFDFMLLNIKGIRDTTLDIQKRLAILYFEKQGLIVRRKELESEIKKCVTYMGSLKAAKMLTDFRTKARYEENDFTGVLEKI